MLLSEAIRIGATKRPQSIEGKYFHNDCSCALGAAYETVYGYRVGQLDIVTEGALIFTFPELEQILEGVMIINHVIFQNDVQHFPREAIADWLAERGY